MPEALTDPFPLTAFLLIAAPFIGSFLGTLVLRLPTGQAVIAARSACAQCGHRLGVMELLPLLSYALQRGRCRHCAAPLPLFYPAIELAALGVVLWAMTETSGPVLLLTCLLGWVLLPLALIDRRHFLLPDALTLPLLALGLLGTVWLDPLSLPDHALGAAVGYTIFAAISLGYRRLRGRDGLGWGDVKLLAACGAWLGWAGLPSVVLMASILGLLEALLPRLRGTGPPAEERIAFGTWLCAGLWLGWLYGPQLPG